MTICQDYWLAVYANPNVLRYSILRHQIQAGPVFNLQPAQNCNPFNIPRRSGLWG